MSAVADVEAALARIAERNPALNAFTAVTGDRARARAAHLDASGEDLPLKGVPFAVKNLFDIAGLPTLAGSRINREHPPAGADAALVRRMEAAGAVLVGALNMGEYAYDFTGENVHDGPSRNPYDLTRMSGGSSGGSGSAVGGGLVPIALGSDTNGSIRVPSSFCGIFGLKPTYGRLSRAGSFPFVSSLDHLGPFATTVRHLTLAYNAMQGPDPDDPACAGRAAEPVDETLGIGGLRVRVLGGYFREGATDQALAAVAAVAQALGAGAEAILPEAARARAAAYVITTTEGAALHLDRLRARPADFDPAVRDRLIAGALVPAALVTKAQRFRRWFQAAARQVFQDCDILLAPSTPCPAPLLGQTTLDLAGEAVPLRPNIGIYTQPISFIGLPVAAVPVWLPDAALPIGVQVIAAPWREDLVLRAASFLEQAGICRWKPCP
jgi:1-carboxybiuret hydrolase